MKFLVDENLSPALCSLLRDIAPDAVHVRESGLKGADDVVIWEFARERGFAIVTKDDDFRDRALLQGSPPKVIILGLGNCTTAEAEAAVRRNFMHIQAFLADSTASILEIPGL